MNVYIYDDFLDKIKYNKVLNKVEIRLTDLGLNGKIIRLGSIKNVQSIIRNELKRGAKTIIPVGNNKTISKVINAILSDNLTENTVPIGIIPIGDNNSIAKSLGIKDEEAACDILLARRVKRISTGMANNIYFLSQLSVKTEDTELKINNDYSISCKESGQINIINIPDEKCSTQNILYNPEEDILHLEIVSRLKDRSHFIIKELDINNPKSTVLIDKSLELQTPVHISLSNKSVYMIVGKERSFV